MTNETITYQDVLDLEQAYTQAKSFVDQIGFVNGYPDYPKAISKFMLSLSQGKWKNANYQPAEIITLIESLDVADMLDCRSILTACSRGERFSDGHWKNVLNGNLIDRVIGRAKTLTQESV